MKNIITITKQLNGSYDPNCFGRSNNGGNYNQPQYTIVTANGNTIRIDDTSCGSFGDRYSILFNNEVVAWYDDMNNFEEYDEESGDWYAPRFRIVSNALFELIKKLVEREIPQLKWYFQIG